MKTMNHTVVLVSLLAGLLLVGSISGCSFNVSVSTASLSDATMCRTIDADGKPLTRTDTFTPNDPVIYCSVKYLNAPSGTEVKAQWIYLQGEQKDLKNYTIADNKVAVEGSNYAKFSLLKPTNGWPRGDYSLKLFINDQEKTSVPFKVQ